MYSPYVFGQNALTCSNRHVMLLPGLYCRKDENGGPQERSKLKSAESQKVKKRAPYLLLKNNIAE
jgi:hypothetical protein